MKAIRLCKELPPRVKNILGKQVGSITVIGFAGLNKEKKSLWLCRCECGHEKIILAHAIRPGRVSCGCVRRGAPKTHGKTNTPEFHAWKSMRDRCSNPNNRSYHRYGGRGIRVSEQWDASFDIFFGDIGPRPSPKHSIDRIDNEGRYSKENCRWATKKEQSLNQSRNRRILFKGENLTLSQWNERAGFKGLIINSRLKCGWSMEKAMTTPMRQIRKITALGLTLTGAEWTKKMGFSKNTITQRIYYGWTPETAASTPLRKRRP